ncbi:hypothetical protein J6590_044976 [Homalodisca vitripennis]|nr:hypothetical protein J6590_044976 [Homalodisca vitripennis]
MPQVRGGPKGAIRNAPGHECWLPPRTSGEIRKTSLEVVPNSSSDHGYADDNVILVSGKFKVSATELTNAALNIVGNLAIIGLFQVRQAQL